MFFLNLDIHFVFFFELFRSFGLLLQLFVKLLSYESTAFLLSENCLFLFLVVKQLVEFLDSCPFIVFGNLAVNLSGSNTTGSD
jgi:hypothetical protein